MNGDICWYCDGTGEIDCISRAPCPWCDGAGWIEDEDYYEDSPEELEEGSEYDP